MAPVRGKSWRDDQHQRGSGRYTLSQPPHESVLAAEAGAPTIAQGTPQRTSTPSPSDAPLTATSPVTAARTYGSALTGDPLSPLTAASTPGSSLTVSAPGSPLAFTPSAGGHLASPPTSGSPLTPDPLTAACDLSSPQASATSRSPQAPAVATESEDSLTSTCDMEVANVLTSATHEKILASPYKATTVMTNIQRGNVQTETPKHLTSQRDRDLSQLAGQGELNIIKALVRSDGVGVATSRDAHGLSLLEWAAYYGQVECVQYLVGVVPPCSHLPSVNAALLFGAARGHALVCQVLLDAGGACVDCTCAVGITPLMYAIHGDHGRTVDVLLQRGASLAARVPTHAGAGGDGAAAATATTVMDFAIERRDQAPIAMQAIENYVMGALNGSASS